MKKIILVFLLTAVINFSQEKESSQGIELPDFVITGKESISIPKQLKEIPDFVPLLSSDFLTPQYYNEEQAKIEMPKVKTEVINIGNYHQKNNALLKVSAGIHTWPKGEFYYNDWSGNLIYNLNLFGKRESEYEPNAGVSNAGLKLGTSYFVPLESSFLPGLEISLDGKYKYESFYFYGVAPNLERKVDDGFANLAFYYNTSSVFNFGLSFRDGYFAQKDLAINENVFSTNSYMNIALGNFVFDLKGTYKNQSTENIGQENKYYFKSEATLGFSLFDFLNLKAGAYLSEHEGNTFFSPVGYASIKFNNYFSVFGEFSPNTDFFTLSDFNKLNRYATYFGGSIFTENKFNIKGGAKFEYGKYFEISGGAGYTNSDNNYYFEQSTTHEYFDVKTDNTDHSFAYLNFLFRKGPYGEFYSEIKVQRLSGTNSKILPYSPTVLGDITYRYLISENTGFEIGLNYSSDMYSDYENTTKIASMYNLNSSLFYEVFNDFSLTLELNNLLNDKYYYFRNYKAKPLDLLIGAEYRW